MKKMYIFLALALTVLALPLKAQTDVTALHLTNANFNTPHLRTPLPVAQCVQPISCELGLPGGYSKFRDGLMQA